MSRRERLALVAAAWARDGARTLLEKIAAIHETRPDGGLAHAIDTAQRSLRRGFVRTGLRRLERALAVAEWIAQDSSERRARRNGS